MAQSPDHLTAKVVQIVATPQSSCRPKLVQAAQVYLNKALASGPSFKSKVQPYTSHAHARQDRKLNRKHSACRFFFYAFSKPSFYSTVGKTPVRGIRERSQIEGGALEAANWPTDISTGRVQNHLGSSSLHICLDPSLFIKSSSPLEEAS